MAGKARQRLRQRFHLRFLSIDPSSRGQEKRPPFGAGPVEKKVIQGDRAAAALQSGPSAASNPFMT
jgi:hypothetical protein